MKFKDLLLILLILVASSLNNNVLHAESLDLACEKYKNLKCGDFPYIKREDLPEEFTDSAFKTIDEFIKKTYNLSYECLIYFDYKTGEIIRCAMGKLDGVELTFDDNEFEGFNVASLHNHPAGIFSPPSGKNFGILGRTFEDYELIASMDGLWIFKAKIIDFGLMCEFNTASLLFFYSIIEQCSNRYNDEKIADKMIGIKYGNLLLNYINNKNINDIQLTKKEYVIMETKPNIQKAEYFSMKRITDPEVFRIARERERDPNILSGTARIYAFYKMMGMDVTYEELDAL